MPSVFEYKSANEFLRDSLSEKKAENPRFSMRAWAKSLGLKNPAPLALMLTGRRPVSRRMIPLISKSLNLRAREAMYLESLVTYERAAKNPATAIAAELYFQRLKSLAPTQKFSPTVIENFKLLENPLYITLLEMSELAEFRWEAEWLRNRLRKKPPLFEIRRAMRSLEGVGLIHQNDAGRWVKTHRDVTSDNDIPQDAVKTFHRMACDAAKSAISDVPVPLREFQSFILNIHQEDVVEIKTRLRRLLGRAIRKIEAEPSQGNETYQLNLQFFPKTNSPKINPKESL